MKLFLPKYPSLLKILYPERITKLDNSLTLYLTFDDGPVPEATPWVLDLLKKHDAKASFFCIGDNVKKHPDIFRRIKNEGHCIGNHSFNHLNGWKTSKTEYLQNVWQADEIMNKVSKEKKGETSNSELLTTNHKPRTPDYKLFRPPYGRIRNSQAKLLKDQGFKIVMWDVISGDYEKDFSVEKCYQHVIKNATSGSTIVFHDSKKAFKNLQVILPKILEYYSEKGFEFRSLKDVL